MRFNRYNFRVKQPDLSDKKLNNAAKAIERQRQKMGLFADFTETMTPEQRIRLQTDAYNERVIENRARLAAMWRECRKAIYSLPSEQREQILAEWNRCKYPGEPAYLKDFLMSKGVIARPEINWESMHYEQAK
jgi:hypothetical protein